MMRPFAEAADLKARVSLADLVGRYTKLAKRGSRLWGCCPIHADSTPSFKIEGERFRCFGCGAHGDLFDFVAAVEGITAIAAIERVRELVGGVQSKPSPKPAPPVPKTNNSKRAQELWRQTVRIRRDRLAMDYLVCRRGITAWDDDRVRWHPQCPWGRERVGCIVVPVVCHHTGLTVAIWRIRPAMEGAVERRGLGPCKHNYAPVCAATGGELALAEGCEDAAAFAQQHGMPAWATLSAGGMASVILPPRLRRIVVCADADAAGLAAAQQLARRLRADGRSVRILAPTHGKDCNDVLRRAVS